MIILASKSPRRKELMHKITNSFSIFVSEIDEESSYKLGPVSAVKDISKRKALEIAKSHPDDTIIGADTIVVIDNKIIGKPIDEDDAKRILKMLSGRSHEVITGYTIINKDICITNVVSTEVIFNNLCDELIDSYVASGSPMDKAGAYGAQDNNDFKIIKEIKGSHDNVIGFPIDEIKRDLLDNKLI